jgi:hypothetical protein
MICNKIQKTESTLERLAYNRGKTHMEITMSKFRINNGYKQYLSGNGWAYTHRRVAEKQIGHAIPKGYEVHHKNAVKTDNRPANLAIFPKGVHQKIHRNK